MTWSVPMRFVAVSGLRTIFASTHVFLASALDGAVPVAAEAEAVPLPVTIEPDHVAWIVEMPVVSEVRTSVQAPEPVVGVPVVQVGVARPPGPAVTERLIVWPSGARTNVPVP